MNHYRTSTGESLSKGQIDRKIRKAKKEKLQKQKIEHGYNFCEDCGKSSGTYLDCSHDVSVKKGTIEMGWDLNNITIRCRECHLAYGDGKLNAEMI